MQGNRFRWIVGGAVAWGLWRQWQRRQVPAFSTAMGPGTAVITGASSGLGAEFARQLAEAGYNLVLTARRQARLQTLAADLVTQYGVAVKIIAADLAELETIAHLEKVIDELDDLALLVNNAGFGTPGKLVDLSVASQMAMLTVQVTAPMRLTKAALPGLLRRGSGGVINVSSLAAYFATPGDPNYNASKAYLKHFSEGVNRELAGSGVHVQALIPGFTYTEFHDTPQYEQFTRSQIPRFFWMDAQPVVADSLRLLPTGQSVVVPGWLYKGITGLADMGFNRLLLDLFYRMAQW